MTKSSATESSTKVSRIIKAPRNTIYQAFLDKDRVLIWLPPENMTGHMHIFEPHEGGQFRMSLTYIDPTKSPPGKTDENTDTVQGRFVTLIPNESIMQVFEFESQDPDYGGEMKLTWTLTDAEGGTEVTVLCENVPKGVRLEDNEAGSRESLQKLAALVE